MTPTPEGGQPTDQPHPQSSLSSTSSIRKSKNPVLWWGGFALGLVVLAAIVVLVVIPIFNRSTRTEADPFAVSRNNAAVQAAPVSGTVVATTPSSTNTSEGTKPLGPGNPSGLPALVNGTTAQIVGRGDFTKIDAIHYARGTATVGIGTDGKKVLRFENFTSAQGPDLKVYLGIRSDGSLLKDDGLNLGALPATDGSYNIPLPDDLDLTKYHSVVIWCEAFNVSFSVANLV